MALVTPPVAAATALPFEPGPVLRVYGMRRSGNHAILDAFLRNAPGGNAVFFNNCKRAQDPVGTYRSLEVRGAGTPVKSDAPLADRLAYAGRRPLTLVSVEDAMPGAKATAIWHENERPVLIYRSFLNWAASLLQKIKGNARYGPVERMRIMTQACRTYGAALRLVAEPGDILPVLYDRWVASETYRGDILAALDLPHGDLSLGSVQRYGGGSSFQSEARVPEDLDSDRRASALANDPEFCVFLWLVAHDADMSKTIARHFPDDATRLLGLAEAAKMSMALPDDGARPQ